MNRGALSGRLAPGERVAKPARLSYGPVSLRWGGSLQTRARKLTLWRRDVKGNYVAVVIGLAVILSASLATGLQAQGYPQPTGNIIMTAACPPGMAGSTVDVTATVQDQFGKAVSGAYVTFTIAAQSGTEGNLYLPAGAANGGVNVSTVTNENGIAAALLNVGPRSGSITIKAVSGPMATQVVCPVSAPGAKAPELVLPATGTGSDDTVLALARLGLAAGLAVLLIALPVGVAVLRAWRHAVDG